MSKNKAYNPNQDRKPNGQFGQGGGTTKPVSGRNPANIQVLGKPESGYSEQPSSRNPGKPRSGVRPRDLYPERGPGTPPLKPVPSSRNPGSPRSGVRPQDLYPERYPSTPALKPAPKK